MAKNKILSSQSRLLVMGGGEERKNLPKRDMDLALYKEKKGSKISHQV